MTWLIFAALTVLSWGVYGVLLHTGQMAMGDPVNGRYKAYLFVGIAYLVVAVFGSLIVLKLNNVEWSFTSKGMLWSTVAGVAGAIGAIGAIGVLLAFGAKGSPAVAMSLVFAGAPIDRQRFCGHGRSSARRRLCGAELAFCAGDRHGCGWGVSGDVVSTHLGGWRQHGSGGNENEVILIHGA